VVLWYRGNRRYIMDLLALWSAYILWFFFLKNSSITLLDEIHNHYYLNSKYYLKTPRFIKKCFMIRKHKIPKFICFRLFLSLVSIILALVGTIIYFCMNRDLHIIGVMIMGLCILAILDIIQLCVLMVIFKKYRR